MRRGSEGEAGEEKRKVRTAYKRAGRGFVLHQHLDASTGRRPGLRLAISSHLGTKLGVDTDIKQPLHQ